ncbi:MaoC family dehydratase [Litchfieldella xinjiangensis]|uniref:MaoC family dehydratase n=1 Tax=Litchfieldella xinjiangensis TaxID=1166948 RepID=UPI0005BE2A94|nr:MaoC family dehydratase [Halomonas xinjiangensis]
MTSVLPLFVGETATFSKSISERDIELFANISGDHDPIHIDNDYARETIFGGKIAHGILSMAILSTVAAIISERAKERGYTGVSVSLGYDKVRFLKPVFPDDTLTATYTISELDHAKSRSYSIAEITNQKRELCVHSVHIMKWN